jgi:hypothetical protein
MMGEVCVSGRGLFRTTEIIYLEKLKTMNFDSRIYFAFPINVVFKILANAGRNLLP